MDPAVGAEVEDGEGSRAVLPGRAVPARTTTDPGDTVRARPAGPLRGGRGLAARRAGAWALVAPPAVWLAVRLSGAGAGTPVETLLVFTPYVALASVVVLVGVALLRVHVALVAAGVCCLAYALLMAPLFMSGPHPPQSPAGPGLKVMTVNVQFGLAAPERVVELVHRADVDVLGVQELTPEFHEQLLAAGLGGRLPEMVVDARPGAAGTGIYGRHPMTRAHHTVPGQHENPSARIAVPEGPAVEVTVVHPVPPLGSAGLADWRATIRALPRPDGSPTSVHVLLGDFNATLDQPTMRGLVDGGYVDAADAVGRAWVETWNFRFVALAIDHVLVDRSIAVRQVTIHDVDGSDHRAVVASLRLPAVPGDGAGNASRMARTSESAVWPKSS